MIEMLYQLRAQREINLSCVHHSYTGVFVRATSICILTNANPKYVCMYEVKKVAVKIGALFDPQELGRL